MTGEEFKQGMTHLGLSQTQLAKRLGVDRGTIAFTLCAQDTTYNGELLMGNCRAMNKVTNLQNRFGDLSQYEIYADGDSAGDKEMLAVANHPHYRNFII